MDIVSIAVNVILILNFFEIKKEHSTDDCDLQKKFDTEFATGKFSPNWRASHYGGGLSLMYFEESNFDRREDAEFIFHKPAAIPARVKVDSNRVASQFADHHIRTLTNDPKFPPGFEIRKGKESIEIINGITWHKMEVFVGGIEKETRREHRISYYVRVTSAKMYAITLSVLQPEIPTVEKEFPCIMNSIAFKTP